MPIARELAVLYDEGGSETKIGGDSTTLLLDGEYTLSTGPDGVTFACVFVLRSTTDTDAAFKTLQDATEAALRTPRKRLRVELGSEIIHDWNPASGINTGYNQDPDLVKVGDESVDSGRSQRYSFTVTLDTPANLYDQAGRRDSTVTLGYTPSRRRTLSVTGEYRSETSTDSARAKYEAGITTYIGTLTTALTGTWELAEEPSVSANDTDTICTFAITYEEIKYAQSKAGLDHAAIVQPQMVSRAIRSFPGDSPGRSTSRLVEVAMQFSCDVRFDESTDLVGLYKSTIRPWIWTNTLKAYGAGSGALLDEDVGYDWHENRITASMRAIISTGGGTVEYRITTDLFRDEGIVMLPIWNGDGFARYIYNGPQTLRRTITETSLVLGTSAAKKTAKSKPGGAGPGVLIDGAGPGEGPGEIGVAIGGGGGDGGVLESKSVAAVAGGIGDTKKKPAKPTGGAGSGAGKWYLLTTQRTTTPIKKGDPSIGTLTFTEVRIVTVEEWAVPVGEPVRKKKKKPGTSAAF